MEKRLRFFFAMFSTSDCGHAFCTTTHLNTLCTGSLRSNHYGMALLQQHHRAAQPVQPQPQNPPSSVSLLHVQLFQGSGKDGWISLGGVLLRITGRQHDFLADFFLFFLQIHVTMISHRPQKQLIFAVGWTMCRSKGHVHRPVHLSWLYKLVNERRISVTWVSKL